MHRISTKQNRLLDELREQGRRIEKLSKIEHDLLKEVHPHVGEIKESIDQIVAAAHQDPASSSVAGRAGEEP